MSPKNYEKMIENRKVFERRKTRLSLVDADTILDHLTDINKDCLILLNKTNSDKVENAIKNDFAYINYIEIVAESIKAKNGGVFPKHDKASVVTLVKIIDYVNNTNVWVHCYNSFFKMVDFIVDSESNFWVDLKKGEKNLVGRLTDYSKGKVYRRGRGEKEKEEKEASFSSLASKICKYFAQYALDSCEDHYYIDDKFIRKVLPYYYHYYLGKDIHIARNEYIKLYDAMEELRTEISKTDKLTRNELDHIMWYCYKSSGE